MKKWEYKIVNSGSFNFFENEKLLNEHGKDGWELVCVSSLSSDIFYFKREIT